MNKSIRNTELKNAISLLRKGISEGEIQRQLRKKYPKLTENQITSIVTTAVKQIVDNNFIAAEEIIPIHLNRYNKQIEELLAVKDADDLIAGSDEELHFDSKTYYQLRNKKIRAFSDCLNAMRQKEELLQLHDINFTLNLNSEERIIIQDRKPEINLNKLTLEEQVELYNLLKKCRIDVSEVIGIKTNAQVVEDIPIEEVNLSDMPNINFIKTEVLQEEVIEEKRKDPTREIQKSLLIENIKKLKAAGANLTDEENELIQNRNTKSQQN